MPPAKILMLAPALFAATFAVGAAHAQAEAPSPCEQTANATAKRLGTSVEQSFEKPGEYQLAAPAGAQLRFSCPTERQRFPRLTLSWHATYPPKAFWDLVSKAGEVMTNASIRRVGLAGHQCHKAALLSDIKRSAVRQKGLGIECEVIAGDDAATSVTVHLRSNRRP
jgi:hypothetical protein